VSTGFVAEGELSEISADHVELDLNVVECFSVVDCDVVSNHFGEDNSVTEMSFDGDWLFSGLCILL
jgi:hypothetical protein